MRLLNTVILLSLNDGRHTLAAADAEGRQTVPEIAARHFMSQRDENSGTGASDGMSERNTATMQVSLAQVDIEFPDAAQ